MKDYNCSCLMRSLILKSRYLDSLTSSSMGGNSAKLGRKGAGILTCGMGLAFST